MAEFIPASHDVIFKTLFVRNKELLRAFLHDALGLPLTEKDKIYITDLVPISEQSNGALSSVTIHADTPEQRYFIDLQARQFGFSADSIIYRAAKMLAGATELSDRSEKIPQLLSVNILGSSCSKDDNYQSSFKLTNTRTGKPLIEKADLLIFELPKVPNEPANDIKLQWLRLFRADSVEALEAVRDSTSDRNIRVAVEDIYRINADKQLCGKIRKRDKAIREYENDMAAARDEGLAKGVEIGIVKGKAKGIAEGVEIGVVKGTLKILIGLIQKGMLTPAQAAEEAGMTPEDFEKQTGIKVQ